MTDQTYTITHDAISPEADVVTETELRAYLTERRDEDQTQGWQQVIDTLTVRDDGIYAAAEWLSDDLVMIAEIVAGETLDADGIPSETDIDAMAGTGSRYQSARHEVWSAIRAARERHGLTDQVVDAIEWAQILDSSVPARNGAQLEIADFKRRAIAALHGDNINDLLAGLPVLAQAAEDAQQALRDGVRAAKAAGCSWDQIGQQLGVSRQAAQQRFGE